MSEIFVQHQVRELISNCMPWVACAIGLYAILFLWEKNDTLAKKFPFFDERKPGEFLYSNAKTRFLDYGAEYLRGCQEKARNFLLITERGRRLVLSGEYSEEIRNDTRLSHAHSLQLDWCTALPGFEPFSNGKRHGKIVNDIVIKLTRALPLLTHIIMDETNLAMKERWTDSPEWHEISLHSSLVRMIAQISSRVFLGTRICRDEAWLETTIDYTERAFDAVQSLQAWPRPLLGLVHWFLPKCRLQRKRMSEVGQILMPIVHARRAERAEAARNGKAKDWEFLLLDVVDADHQAEGYDPVISQLGLTFAAIHTTSDLLAKVILDLCKHPELIQPLRDEIASVVKEDGWQKTSLYKLKLLDSVMKETQRLAPISAVTMRRIALQDISLEDGTEIPKGTALCVTTSHMWEPGVYTNADQYDGYRFLKWREDPTREHKAHLVSTSPEHLGFGHGKHACPGRFFAANEAKIVMCHILMKYDWKLVEQNIQNIQMIGLFSHVNGNVKLQVRRRQEEVAL